jgi:hypothetical protein
MPTQLTIPASAQFGVGTFEPFNTFHGLAGLRWAWESSFGPMLPTLDEAFTGLPGAGGIMLFPPAPGASNVFSAAGQIALGNVTQAMTHTQHAAASHYVQQSFLFDGFATAIRNAAESQLTEKKAVRRRIAPAKIIQVIRPTVRANLKPLQKAVREANARAKHAEAENVQLRKRVARLEKASMRPHAVAEPGVIPRLGDLERWRGRITGEVNRLGKLAGIGAFLILLAKALEKMGASYIRCTQNKRWGSHVCRNGEDFLSALIAATSLLVATYDLKAFAKMMQGTTGEVTTAAKWFWQVK